MNNTFSQVPPGFRFHPTDEELVDYYLRRKVASRPIDLDVIKEVDLYRIEPWDLQELCRIGTEEQNEWYFFSHKDKKYPTGTRTNRATAAGFWKATGRDKAIYSKHDLIGMRKTLVFYKGRAPNGQKSDWIMHEYRLETEENGVPQEEGWVVCRAFKKKMATMRKLSEHDSPIWYDDQVSLMPDMESPSQQSPHSNILHRYPYMSPNCKNQMESQYGLIQQDPFLQLPQLESPKILQARNSPMSSIGPGPSKLNPGMSPKLSEQLDQSHDQNLLTDWRVLDKFVASQLSHEQENDHEAYRPGLDDSEGPENTVIRNASVLQEMGLEKALGSSSGCEISDIWKCS